MIHWAVLHSANKCSCVRWFSGCACGMWCMGCPVDESQALGAKELQGAVHPCGDKEGSILPKADSIHNASVVCSGGRGGKEGANHIDPLQTTKPSQ